MQLVARLLLPSLLSGILACGGTTDDSGPSHDAGSDAAKDASADPGDTRPDSRADATSDAILPSDTTLDTADAGASTEDAADADADVHLDTGDASLCPPPELLFPASKSIEDTTKLLPFAGYLWVTSYGGLTRAPLAPGTPTAVAKVGGYPEVHAHGSKLLVVDSFDVGELDPSTLVVTHLFSLTGSYSNYLPRTALVGETLHVLRDDGTGSELGSVSLADGTWTSLWKGAKAYGLHRAKERTLVFGAKFFDTVVDPGSTAAVIDTTGFTSVTPLASDGSGTYLSMYSPTSSDLYRVPIGSATPEPLHYPGWAGAFLAGGGDGTHFVATVTAASGSVETFDLLTGTTWTKLPCVSGAFWSRAVAIDGGWVYAATSSTDFSVGDFIVRAKLP